MGARLKTALFGACVVALTVAAPSAHAAFPGANGKIAYDDASVNYTECNRWCRDEYAAYIHTINPDGSGDAVITPFGGWDQEPAWSADGKQLAFAQFNGCATGCSSSDISTMHADGSSRTRLTSAPAKAFDREPAWSPDGNRIAFTRFTGPPNLSSGSDIYTTNADGTNQSRLTITQSARQPTWSPDGTKIAFVSGSRTASDIWTVHPDGSGLTQLTNDSSFWFVEWSPDGSKLIAGRGAAREGYVNHLAILSADGTVIREFNYWGDGFTSTAWSPDGTSLTFAWTAPCYDTCSDAFPRLYVQDMATGLYRMVREEAENPSWQPLNRAPVCSTVAATPNTLWPPNRRLVSVSLSGATDPDGDQVTLTLTGATQDEPTGRKPDAVLGPATNQVKLRATRSGHGDGRVYRIAFTASDGRGGSCSGTARVSVPRKKRKAAIDSAPPSYDSLVH